MTVLVVFDIEAVPAASSHSQTARLTPRSDGCWENVIRDNGDPTKTFLKVPIYRIVSIATLNAKREDGGGPWTVSQIGSRSGGEKTEAEVLLGFVKALPVDSRGTGPILVTFGGNGFDLPLLRYRAFALSVPVPGLHGGGHRNYRHRFGQDHVDLPS
jgi:predicted PolB exonuclease-like 3'-5' exonuclease